MNFNLPPGTPRDAPAPEQLAPVWCAHGIRWTPEVGGYRPDTIDAAHPDLLCRDYGAIPEVCHPAVPHPPADTDGGAS